MDTEEFFQSSTPIQSLHRLTRRSSGRRLCSRRLASPFRRREGRVVEGQGDRRPDVPGANGRRKRSAHQPVTSARYPAKVSGPIEARPISREIGSYRDSLCIEGVPSKTAREAECSSLLSRSKQWILSY